ncbi:MAG: tetratricopeptide repeat protein [Verrucomicrobiota bacterium]
MQADEQQDDADTEERGIECGHADFKLIADEEDRYESGVAMTSNARRTMWQMALGLICLGLLVMGLLVLVRYRDDISGERVRESLRATVMPTPEANAAVRAMPDYEEAVEALGSGNFERVLSRVGVMELHVEGSSATRYMAAQAYDGLGEAEAAREAIDLAAERSPDDVEILYFRGRLLQALGDEGATAVFEHLVRVDGNVAEAWHELGNLYLGSSRDEEAMAAYERALDLERGHMGARDGLARIFEARGLPEEAQSILEEGYELDPDNAEACLRLSMFYCRHGDLEKGGTYALEALHAAPKSARAISWLASVLEKQGNKAGALAMVEEALAKAPDDPSIALQAGYFLAKSGRPARSIMVLKRVLEAWPQNDAALLLIGSNYMAQNRYIEAREYFEKVVAIKPDRLEAWEGLAEVCRILEERAAAESAMERVTLLRGEAGD